MITAIINDDLDRIIAADLPWDRLSGKTILVTGAAGVLPAYMVETLLRLNDRRRLAAPLTVLGMVRDLPRARARFAHHGERSDLVLVQHDVTQPFAWDGPLDVIVHAASQASPKYYSVDPVGTLAANTVGTHNLLQLARTRPLDAFLFFSSSEVYGQVGHDMIPTREDQFGLVDPATVRACYAESKRLGETMCVAWSHQHGVPTRIVRPFHTYGPGMRLDDGRVFADFVSDILASRDIIIKSDGLATRSFCYIADATAGFFTVLLKGETAVPYNVGNDRAEISIRGLAEALVDEFRERGVALIMDPEKRAATYVASQVPRNCPDIGRMRALGWEPGVGIAEGFRRTVTSFEQEDAARPRA